jgi:hypothetical protein
MDLCSKYGRTSKTYTVTTSMNPSQTLVCVYLSPLSCPLSLMFFDWLSSAKNVTDKCFDLLVCEFFKKVVLSLGSEGCLV